MSVASRGVCPSPGHVNVGRDPVGNDENEDVWQVYQEVRLQAEGVKMPEEIGHHVNGVPDAEGPEIDARELDRDERGDQRKRTGAEVAEVDQLTHVKESEHEPVLVHDAGNVIKQVDAQEESGKPKRALLDRAESFWHGSRRW